MVKKKKDQMKNMLRREFCFIFHALLTVPEVFFNQSLTPWHGVNIAKPVRHESGRHSTDDARE